MLFNLARFTLLSIICFLCMSNGDLHKPLTPNFNITNAPFTVVVLCTNSKYFCTGVIVDVAWVLTAAHCLHDLTGELTEDKNSVLVVAGTNGLHSTKEEIKSGQAQIKKTKQIVIQDNYIWRQNFVNDIALIQVSEPFVPSEWVAVAVLNRSMVLEEIPELPDIHGYHNAEEMKWPCRSYGYGKEPKRDENVEDNSIKEQNYIINKHCHCLERIRSYKSPVEILRERNIFICDSDIKDEKNGLCAGDNGAPLMCNGALRAVASTVFHYTDIADCKLWDDPAQVECGSLQSLDVFTDVCYFGQWLNSVVKSYPRLDELCKVVDEW